MTIAEILRKMIAYSNGNIHDIACPLCREKYGNRNGKYQEEEGVPLTRTFLSDCGLGESQIDRVAGKSRLADGRDLY